MSVHKKTKPSKARSGHIARHLYSFADMPGALPVNTLGRGWLPTPESKAIEPATINTSVITVPAINTNGLNTRQPKQPAETDQTAHTRSRPFARTCGPPSTASDPPNLWSPHTHR